MCGLHLERRRENDKRRKQLRLSHGLCEHCSSPLDNATKLCSKCVEKKANWSADFRDRQTEKSLCYRCSRPIEDPSNNRCDACIEKVKEKQKTRLAAGSCYQCDNPRLIDNKLYCIDCWLKEKSYQVFNTRKKYELLKTLWNDQKGLCAYTKVTLAPGSFYTHLEHKTPLSRGGKNEIENLQWTQRKINLLKDTQTHEEFLASIPELLDLLSRILPNTKN